jgi:GNAT superfamily N-acetyltransferase
MQILTITNGDFSITTDKTKLQIKVIHDFLAYESYWAKDIPLEYVERAIENSLCFGVFYKNEQVGLARIVSDYTTFAYLCDVFILEKQRGQGLSKWLVETIMAHPNLQGLRRWVLLTADAHELYKKYGWQNIAAPERYLEIRNIEVYQKTL